MLSPREAVDYFQCMMKDQNRSGDVMDHFISFLDKQSEPYRQTYIQDLNERMKQNEKDKKDKKEKKPIDETLWNWYRIQKQLFRKNRMIEWEQYIQNEQTLKERQEKETKEYQKLYQKAYRERRKMGLVKKRTPLTEEEKKERAIKRAQRQTKEKQEEKVQNGTYRPKGRPRKNETNKK